MLESNAFDTVKKLAIIGLFSDDYLLNKLVLKGGNCINIAYNLSTRASLDLDFSMEDDFKEDELNIISKNQACLIQILRTKSMR